VFGEWLEGGGQNMQKALLSLDGSLLREGDGATVWASGGGGGGVAATEKAPRHSCLYCRRFRRAAPPAADAGGGRRRTAPPSPYISLSLTHRRPSSGRTQPLHRLLLYLSNHFF